MVQDNNGPALLSVRNLRIEFPTRRGTLVAVDDISFDISPGEILGVVGESGAGKSLTGAAIIGLLEPPGRIARGEISLEGRRIDNLPYEEIRRIRGRRIGAIFQDPLTSLNPLYSVSRQLIETIRTHLSLNEKQARDRALELLEEVGIPGAADLTSVSFYTNDFETTTTGIDLVASWDLDWGDMGSGNLIAAWNWTETEVDNAGSEVSRNRVVSLENFNPENRGVFTYNHFYNDFRFLARLRTYDDWIVGDWSGDPTLAGSNGTGHNIDCTFGVYRDNCYDGENIFDVEAAYTWNDNYTFIVGANNLFDEEGEKAIDNMDGTIGSGNKYTGSTPWGIEGAFYYARLRVDF